MNRIVVTVSGQNRTGIVAAFSLALARLGGDIQDMTQRISGQLFVMLLVVEIGPSGHPIEVFQGTLKRIGEALNLTTHVQHEDLFKYMHRLGR